MCLIEWQQIPTVTTGLNLTKMVSLTIPQNRSETTFFVDGSYKSGLDLRSITIGLIDCRHFCYFSVPTNILKIAFAQLKIRRSKSSRCNRLNWNRTQGLGLNGFQVKSFL